ncbi:Protein NIM1-INTERACTING [Melia azedarach]|uniref:Protein NIM1-INTERACTING n=1 Tax=Melia azedarach TaxID=155640 RepID=A0ACC1XI29_MELAZ|nr:Protein NIM1-INTERACTING [Melia azedarach]
MSEKGKETDLSKRKAAEDHHDVVPGAEKKARRDNGDGEETGTGTAAATEEEVEEFFAILRRLHVAINYFKNGNAGDKRSLTELEKADVDLVDNGNTVAKDVRDGKNVRLDLNADPESDSDPV